MKPKKFKDGSWGGFLCIEILIFLLLLFAIGICAYITSLVKPNDLATLGIAYSLFGGLGLLIFSIGFFSPRIFDRAFGRLSVYENRIVYKCLFRRTRTLTFEECNYIGIEDYSKLNRGMPVVRGDEISFIYFSTKPYPEKYKGKISLLKNTEDFIKIGYSDALAKALIDILPADKDYLIRSFYGKMQASDRRLGKNKKK